MDQLHAGRWELEQLDRLLHADGLDRLDLLIEVEVDEVDDLGLVADVG